MIVYTGTSGFSYKEWKGEFYPEDLPNTKMLAFYSSKLPAVEINNTFYRLPRRELLATWADDVPETFRFILKASRRITHFKRLNDAGELTEYMCSTASALGSRLGPILFQLPPNFPKDLGRLRNFMPVIAPGIRAAFEFRHPSWHDKEVFEVLAEHNAALCIAHDGEADAEIVPTADWGYLRLRAPGYTGEELDGWASGVRKQMWEEAFVFFKHEDDAAGPAMAADFLNRFDQATRRE